MSAHAISAIGGNGSGETVYCTCGASHEPSDTPMLSAWSKHVEQAVREEVMREAGVSVHAEQAEARLRALIPDAATYAALLERVAKAVAYGVPVVELFTDVNLIAMSADVSCRLVREDKIRELIAQEIESERGAGNAFRDATLDRAAAIARGEWS